MISLSKLSLGTKNYIARLILNCQKNTFMFLISQIPVSISSIIITFYRRVVITRGKGMDVVDPYFFFIDRTDNILITDYYSNSIDIYNTEFRLLHKIPVSNLPTGVTVDNQGRVIVVCQADKDCLLIF